MFVIGAENLPSSMYTPLVVLLAVYAVLNILAGTARCPVMTMLAISP